MKLPPTYFVLSLILLNGTSGQATRMVLALFALDLGASPFTVGMLAASFSLVPMLTVLPAGRLADRYGARWPLLITGVLGAVGLVLPFFLKGMAALFIASALMGLAAGVYQVLLQNLMGLLSDPQNRIRNFANSSLTRSICNFLGPLIGGFSIERSGTAVTCLYIAALASVPVLMLLIRGGSLRGGAPRVKPADSGGVRALLGQPFIRRMLITTSLLNVGADLYQFYMPVYTHSIGLAPSVIGMILATYAATAFVVRSTLPGLVARYSEERLLRYAFYIGAASMLAIPFFKSALLLALISFVFGLGMGACQPIISTQLFTNSAQGRSGETLGLRMTVIHLTKLIGPTGFGALGSAFGLFPVFWGCALLLGAGGAVSKS